MKSIIVEIMRYENGRSPEEAKELLRVADIYLDNRWISFDTHKIVCKYIKSLITVEE